MNDKELPEGWRVVTFGDMAKHISKRVEPSETKLNIYVGLEHLDPDSLKIKRHGVPSDVSGQKLLVKKGQIVFGKRRAYQRKLAVANWDCICSAHAMVLEANPETVVTEFLPYFMQSGVFMNRALDISEGSLSPTIKWKILEIQKFIIPSIEIQTNFLKVMMLNTKNIEMGEGFISATEQLIASLLHEKCSWLLKKTVTDNLDERLSSGYKIVKIKEVLNIKSIRVNMDDESLYQTVVARRAHGGIDERDKLKGRDISVKSQFLIEKGDFLISKRQIVHGGCGIVPERLHGSIVSNEYDVFNVSKDIDMDFWFWLVQTPRMKSYFFINSVGIHIEKMLFKTNQWLNMEIILPSIKEQQSIVAALNELKDLSETLDNKIIECRKINQSLLTGSFR